MSDENSVYIIAACRTPIGSLGGYFKNNPPHKLGAIVIKDAIYRAKINDFSDINEVIMGQVLSGGQGPNPGRLAALDAGIPNSVPAYTVNMLCGSGLKSIFLGYQAIKCGEAQIIVAGGQENMSMANHSVLMRPGLKCGHATFMDNILVDALTDPNIHMHMGDTAEYLAQKFRISRVKQDEYAFKSQTKYRIARENCCFDEEIVPVPTLDGKIAYTVHEDEYPKPETTMERLQSLRPVFKGSSERSVTAGNSSGLNDGAAAVVLCSGQYLMKSNRDYLAKIVGFAQIAIAPEDMGLGPIEAIRNLLRKVDWTMDRVDLFEVNEAFAVQSIIVCNELQIPREKWNVTGGAIAVGHPLGCSGARILVTLLYNLRRLNKERGIAALCIGGGMGIAIAVQREITDIYA